MKTFAELADQHIQELRPNKVHLPDPFCISPPAFFDTFLHRTYKPLISVYWFPQSEMIFFF